MSAKTDSHDPHREWVEQFACRLLTVCIVVCIIIAIVYGF